MLKDKLYILDNLFSHAHSSSWYNKPTLFEWNRDLNGDHIVLTDNMLHMVDKLTNNKKYAWLVESPLITPHAYEFIKHNYNKFDLVFTFDKSLLEISDRFVLIPYGGCWINEEDRKIHEKTKNVSIILSSKKTTAGHILRHSILERFPQIDSFGFNNPIENKITGLKDYRFSIIVENCKQDYYFTEKLIDSFITGTIPIYWGCPSIGDFFDLNGIITFDTVDELNSILNTLTPEKYNNMRESMITNFEISKKYLIADDLIYNIIKNEKTSS